MRKVLFVLMWLGLVSPCLWADELQKNEASNTSLVDATLNKQLVQMQEEIKQMRHQVKELSLLLKQQKALSHQKSVETGSESKERQSIDDAITNKSMTALSGIAQTIRQCAQRALDGLIGVQNLIAILAHKLQSPQELVPYIQPTLWIALGILVSFGIPLLLSWALRSYEQRLQGHFMHLVVRFFIHAFPMVMSVGLFYGVLLIAPLSDRGRMFVLFMGILFFGLKAVRMVNRLLIDPLLIFYGIQPGVGLGFSRRTLSSSLDIFIISISLEGLLSLYEKLAPLKLATDWGLYMAFLGMLMRNIWQIRKPVQEWIEQDHKEMLWFLRGIHILLKPIAPIWHSATLIFLIALLLIFFDDNWQLAIVRLVLSFMLIFINFIIFQKRLSFGRFLQKIAVSVQLVWLIRLCEQKSNEIFYGSFLVSVGVSSSLIYEVWNPGSLLEALSSPFFMVAFSKAIVIGLILIMALILNRIGKTVVDRFMKSQPSGSAQRVQSLASIFKHVWRYIVFFPAILLILSEFGFNITPIIASISVASLGLGLASQHIFKDLFTGLFIVLEDTISIGDIVEIEGKMGTIEEFTLRMVRLRSDDGTVYTIPFGSIVSIANLSRDYAFVIINFETKYTEDLEALSQKIHELYAKFASSPDTKHFVKGALEVRGVSNLGPYGVEFQVRLKTPPGVQFKAKRAFMSLIKDELKDIAPIPEQIIYSKNLA